MSSVQLTTSDGHHLDADLSGPERPVATAVVCHPHPQYGGNRFNPVVQAVFDRLPQVGIAALRFDFRGEFGGGTAERLDVIAALDELERRFPGAPLYVVGYSFGAAVALGTDDPRIARLVTIAPPLAMVQASAPPVPTLVLCPRHDQFSPPATTAPIVEDWPDATLEVVESADHFLAGHASTVATRAAEWLSV